MFLATSPVNQNWGTLHGERQGVMLHFDDSGSDAGALGWLVHDRTCKVSYNLLAMDDGRVFEIAPLNTRAWHAGVCRPSVPQLRYMDGNTAFYGVAIAAKDGEVVTPLQFAAVVASCKELASRHGWDLAAQPWRITGHDAEAWPRGRKIDPTGSNPRRPVLSVAAVRAAFQPATPDGVVTSSGVIA